MRGVSGDDPDDRAEWRPGRRQRPQAREARDPARRVRLPAARSARDGSGGNAGDAKRARAKNRHAERREARAPIARCAPRLADVAVALCERDVSVGCALSALRGPSLAGRLRKENQTAALTLRGNERCCLTGHRRRPRKSGPWRRGVRQRDTGRPQRGDAAAVTPPGRSSRWSGAIPCRHGRAPRRAADSCG